MKLPNEVWVVTSQDINPEFSMGCIWCKAQLGKLHKPDCVRRDRSIVVRVVIEMERFVPESWDQDMIEFHMNESSWCASNIIDELQAMFQTERRCLCNDFTATYVREATKEDEEHYGRKVEDEYLSKSQGVVGIVLLGNGTDHEEDRSY